MRRCPPALLLLLALSGCVDRDQEIVIENRGGAAILVDVQKEYGPWSVRRDDHERDRVPGFTSWVGRYTSQLERIDVVVLRESDGAVLHADSFSRGDFEDFNGHILILAYP